MKRLYTLTIIMVSTLLCGQGARMQQTPHHDFTVIARRYAFEPARLEVHQGDTVRITLRAEDMPHSFVVDAYRIAKKAAPVKDVTFEFVADQPGDLSFYCNLSVEDGCRGMKGHLIVRPSTDDSGSPNR